MLFMQFRCIESLYPQKKLVIILDSLDQLNSYDYGLDWFIEILPANVKMIYSTLPILGDILSKLQATDILGQNPENFLEIKSLDKDLAIQILEDWLKKEKRNISPNQWEVVHSMFSKEKVILYPLYIKLIFDIILKWASFEVPDENFAACNKIDDCIQYLFQSLEAIHGKLLFSRAIIYMSSFKNGISEHEIEDILSLGEN